MNTNKMEANLEGSPWRGSFSFDVFFFQPWQNEGHLLATALRALRCCTSEAKRRIIATFRALRAGTRNDSEVFQKHLLCRGHKIFVREKRCTHVKTSKHFGNMIMSTILPPQSVLVLPAQCFALRVFKVTLTARNWVFYRSVDTLLGPLTKKWNELIETRIFYGRSKLGQIASASPFPFVTERNFWSRQSGYKKNDD